MRWGALAAVAMVAAVTVAPPPVSADARPDPGPAQEGPAAAAPPPDAPPGDGALFDTDASLPEHAEDVADYTLVAKLDPSAHTIHGEGTIRWRNTSSVAVHEVWLHLYLNAFKNERSAFLREPVGGFRGSEPLTDWGYIDVRRFALRDEGATGQPPETAAQADLWPKAERTRPGDDDETDARVPLPREVVPGQTVTFEIAWDSKLPSVLERTGFLGSFHMAGQWFPKLARLEPDGHWAHFPFHHLAEFYADFGTYDVTIDVPAEFIIGATGSVVESRIAGGRRVERHVQSDVHDFAWTAWDHWQTAIDAVGGVKVTVLYPPGFKEVAQRELAAMRFAIPHFGKRYGRYPYPVLTLVHPPERAAEAGGMEYPTLITTGGPWFSPSGVRIDELTTIHEFGHQYFYGLIATDEVSWPFLDEGINSYAESEAMGTLYGEGGVAELLGLRVSDVGVHAVAARRGEHDQPVAQPAYAFTTGSAYGALVYSRTATILETLRRVYGDAAFARALGRYARRSRFKHPGPEDLERALQEVLGEDATSALHTALFDKGWVDYVATAVFSRKTTPAGGIYDRNGKRETVTSKDAAPPGPPSGAYEGWVLVTHRGTLTFPVNVDLVLADGTRQRLHWKGDTDSIRLPYRGAVALRSVVVDPDHAVLLDDDPTNNFAYAEDAATPGAPRTLERVVYWAELLLQLVTP
jgi:hypothetical protein